MIRSKYRTRRAVLIMAILAIAAVADAESLWETTFTGYVSGDKAFGVGEILLVVLDTGTELSYKASYIDSRQIQIELSGGDGGELFSFLPEGSSSTNDSIQGSDEIEFGASIAVRIDSIDEAGAFSVSGNRSLVFGGVTETVSVTGVVDPKFIDEDNTVRSSAVADLRVIYSSLLSDSAPVIGVDDIVRPETIDAAGPAATETATETTAIGAAATEAVDDGTTEAAAGAETVAGTEATEITGVTESGALQLTEEKRQELLLLYLNRLVDLIFRTR